MRSMLHVKTLTYVTHRQRMAQLACLYTWPDGKVLTEVSSQHHPAGALKKQ